MTIFADLAMIVFLPAAVALFMILPARRAVLATFVGGVLFLPMVEYQFAGFPSYSKLSATSIAALLGVVIFDGNRIFTFRPRLLDVPMAAWCVLPLASSLTNQMGAYDGVSGIVGHVLTWGIPYFLGRLYFGDRKSLTDLAAAIVIGGLLYVPLCLFEIRMSPQLHTMLYGFHQHSFGQTYRFGGWRPTVFMQHGLMVGIFMAIASLLAIWMWMTGAMRTLLGVPMLLLVPPLVATTVLCKSAGALVLLEMWLGAPTASHMLNRRVFLLVLVLLPVAYVGARVGLEWSAQELVDAAARVDEQRAASLATRIFHEDMLIERAMERPVFGWGRWGRYRVVDDMGRDQSITDGLWIITFGSMGAAGLAALLAWLLAPPALVFKRVAVVGTAATAAPVALATSLALFASDSIMNAMVNQLWVIIAGALVSAIGVSKQVRRAAWRRARASRRRAKVGGL